MAKSQRSLLKVFLDTSVLISALNSTSGASFHILNSPKYTFFISEFVLTEARNVIARKFSNKISENMLFSFIGATPITVVSLPKKNELKKFMAFVEEKDTPILASSLKYCDILLTLDKEILEANGKIKNLEITTPGELIRKY